MGRGREGKEIEGELWAREGREVGGVWKPYAFIPP